MSSIMLTVHTQARSSVQWDQKDSGKKKSVRRPGVEPGSTAWKATMLTVTPPTLGRDVCFSFIPHKIGQSIRIRYFPHGLYARKTFIRWGGWRVMGAYYRPLWTMYLLTNNNNKLCEISMLGLFSTQNDKKNERNQLFEKTVTCCQSGIFVEHQWFSGRMLACHAGGPGSIPGWCNFFQDVFFSSSMKIPYI